MTKGRTLGTGKGRADRGDREEMRRGIRQSRGRGTRPRDGMESTDETIVSCGNEPTAWSCKTVPTRNDARDAHLARGTEEMTKKHPPRTDAGDWLVQNCGEMTRCFECAFVSA